VTEAVNGEQAIDICRQKLFDIIVMDQYMEESGGVMIGTEVITALREMKVTSIIIGCSGNDVEAEFIASGADLVWKKPLPMNEVIVEQLRLKLQSRQVQTNASSMA
jgi:CheY-like chemotaxis protein